jgi:hypothetical protein
MRLRRPETGRIDCVQYDIGDNQQDAGDIHHDIRNGQHRIESPPTGLAATDQTPTSKSTIESENPCNPIPLSPPSAHS